MGIKYFSRCIIFVVSGYFFRENVNDTHTKSNHIFELISKTIAANFIEKNGVSAGKICVMAKAWYALQQRAYIQRKRFNQIPTITPKNVCNYLR